MGVGALCGVLEHLSAHLCGVLTSDPTLSTGWVDQAIGIPQAQSYIAFVH